MSVAVIAVNDEPDSRSALLQWVTELCPDRVIIEGTWNEVAKRWKGDSALIFLADFWRKPSEFIEIVKAELDSAYLFLFDSTIDKQGPNMGEQALAGLLRSFEGVWWAALLSAKSVERSELTLREFAVDVTDEGVWRRHYLGAGRNWLEDSKVLISDVFKRDQEKSPLIGWKPQLPRLPLDSLSSTIHRLCNVALPISADRNTLDEILQQKSPTDVEAETIRAIAKDYWIQEGASYLARASTIHGGGNLDSLLDEECERLSAALTSEERTGMAAAFDRIRNVLSEVRLVPPSLADLDDAPFLAAAEIRRRLSLVVDAISIAVGELRAIRDQRGRRLDEDL
jgi:hypothetical protein